MNIYNETNPAGFDLVIAGIQAQIACLNFADQIFGVAHVENELRSNQTTEDTAFIQDMGKKGTMKHERWFPQARQNGSDADLTIGDEYISRCFFLVKDPISTSPREDSYDWGSQNPEIKQPFSLLFHCSMSKINNAIPSLTNYEQVKLSLLYALSKCPMLLVNSMVENIENFWKEFSITEEISGFGKYPFYCLRIECEIPYFAFPMNGRQEEYDPSVNYNEITPETNTTPDYVNVN